MNAVKEIKVTGTEQVIQVEMAKYENHMSLSWKRAEASVWSVAANLNCDGYNTEWALVDALDNAQGRAIVQEMADLFEREIIQWQQRVAIAALDPNGSIKPMHIRFLYDTAPKVKA